MATAVKSFGKRVIGYPEERVSVISSKDWVNNLSKDPKREVGPSFPHRFFS